MRDDQYIRLQKLEEKLTDLFLEEADPANWSAAGLLPREMTQQERGDRYWCKKNAVATMSLNIRIGSLLGMVQRRGDDPALPDGDGDDSQARLLDAEIAAAEAEAKKMMARIEKRAKAKAS